MLRNVPCRRPHDLSCPHFFLSVRSVNALFVVCGLILISGGPLAAQSGGRGAAHPARVGVHPGAPGKPTRKLPASTTGNLPPASPAEAEFMRGMIMHHAQAVEMTALIVSRTENKDLRLLGARISNSQTGEINFMRRWLIARGEPTSMAMPGMPNMTHTAHPMPLMPGMPTPEQMEAL